MRISFVIPSRNNLKYLQQAVKSVVDCYGTEHDIVLLDDASEDGTWEWIKSLEGEHFVKYRNEGPERQGHTVLYDKGVTICRTDIFSILHADMVVSPGYVANLLKHLNRRTVVCATRVEPPLHPPGPEKFVKHLGIEPEEFSYQSFLDFINPLQEEFNGTTTSGIFAPWCMYREDFQAIEGHDKLFAPMELEDSDIFNRMSLAGYKLLQSRDAFVYHMTCRGSRFKDGVEIEAEIPLPDGTTWFKPKDSEEYKALRTIKFREWWRKWGCNVLHDKYMLPVVPSKYNIGFVVEHCNLNTVALLEPWCTTLYNDDVMGVLAAAYYEIEQVNTRFDLNKKIKVVGYSVPDNDILVKLDARKLTQHSFEIIQQLSQIIDAQGEIGKFEIDIFEINILNLNTYQNRLITNSDPYYTSQLR